MKKGGGKRSAQRSSNTVAGVGPNVRRSEDGLLVGAAEDSAIRSKRFLRGEPQLRVAVVGR